MKLLFMIAVFTTVIALANETSSNDSCCKNSRKTNQNAIVYKTVDSKDLLCEIDLPNTNVPFPIVLYCHSWSGNLNQLKAYSCHLALKGVAGVRINYRKLSEGTRFEDAKTDIIDAIEFIKNNADKYNFDMNRFGIAGASAGALLSSLIAQQIPECKAYIAFNGSFDLTYTGKSKFPSNKALGSMFGEVTQEKLQRASAIYNIARNPPDTLLLHGTDDITIHPIQTQRFGRAIRKKGGKAEIKLYEGQSHGFFNSGKPCFPDIRAKVDKHLLRVFKIESGKKIIQE